MKLTNQYALRSPMGRIRAIAEDTRDLIVLKSRDETVTGPHDIEISEPGAVQSTPEPSRGRIRVFCADEQTIRLYIEIDNGRWEFNRQVTRQNEVEERNQIIADLNAIRPGLCELPPPPHRTTAEIAPELARAYMKWKSNPVFQADTTLQLRLNEKYMEYAAAVTREAKP